MKKKFYLFLGLTGLVAWFQSSFYTVDQAEFAYVTRFGSPVYTWNGDSEAGLHVKAPWPIDNVQRLERRVQSFDLPATETLTRDRVGKTVDKTITVDAYVCWRIPDREAADRFVRTVGSAEQARRLLTPRVTGRLGAVLSSLPLDEVVKVADLASVDERSDKLNRQVLGLEKIDADDQLSESLPGQVLREYGIEIVEVRIRRLMYPEAVRSSIAERIRSERQRKVAEYQAEGNREYTRIVSDARTKSAKILADARAKKATMEGEADAEADAIRNQAHNQDREFYNFLQKLSAYRAMLSDSRDVLLLSTKNDLFDLLLKPPVPTKKEGKKE